MNGAVKTKKKQKLWIWEQMADDWDRFSSAWFKLIRRM